MALRSNLNIKKANKKSSLLIKVGVLIFFILAILIGGFILYFNGENVKAPLIKFLKERTNLSINCKQVEYSPLYPNIIKIKDLSINDSRIEEIYAEFDLTSLLKAKDLEIKYLYLKKAVMKDTDLTHISNERFGFDNFKIDRFELVDSPFKFSVLNADGVNATLENVTLDKDSNLFFSSGKIMASKGTLDDIEIKDLYATIKDEENSKLVENFSTKIFGGSIHGNFTIDKLSGHINSNSFAVKNIILKDYPVLASRYTINAPVVSVSNSVLALPSMDLYFGQLNGKLSNLKVKDGDIAFVFNGRSGEISKPNMGISTDDNTISISNYDKQTTLKLSGRYINSNYDILCKFTKDESDERTLFIDKFKLSNGRIDLTKDTLNKIHKSLVALNTKIESFTTDKVELVSNIDAFPLTVKDVAVSGSSIKLGNERYIDEGKFSVKLNSGYYKDLFFKELNLKSKFTEDNVLFNIEKLTFNKSALSSIYNYNNKLNTITFKLKADNFDVSELNSDLISRLVNGKVDIDLDLHTEDAETTISAAPVYAGIGTDYLKDENLFLKLKGRLSVKSDELLISGFGLDLLNGGKEGEYKFTLDSLLEALKESDCGLYKLDATVSLDKGVAKLNGKTDLTASSVKTFGEFNLLSDTLDLHALLTTFTKGNISAFHITGKRSSPEYTLKSIKREEVRNGLVLVPALKEEELEKIETQTDSSTDTTDKEKETTSDKAEPPASVVIEDQVQNESTDDTKEKASEIEDVKQKPEDNTEQAVSDSNENKGQNNSDITDNSDTNDNKEENSASNESTGNEELDRLEEELLQ